MPGPITLKLSEWNSRSLFETDCHQLLNRFSWQQLTRMPCPRA